MFMQVHTYVVVNGVVDKAVRHCAHEGQLVCYTMQPPPKLFMYEITESSALFAQ